MATESEILLRIRRTLSKSEKYRFILGYLDSVEIELAKERRLNTNLLKDKKGLLQTINDLNNKLYGLEGRCKKLELLQSQGNLISPERHEQVCKERREFEKKYVEQVRNNIELQHQIDKLKT